MQRSPNADGLLPRAVRHAGPVQHRSGDRVRRRRRGAAGSWRSAASVGVRRVLQSGARLASARGGAQGRRAGSIQAAKHRLPRGGAQLLGVRAGAIRCVAGSQPDGLPGRRHLLESGRLLPGPERAGQPDLPWRHSGDDRRLHRSGSTRGRREIDPPGRIRRARRQVFEGHRGGVAAGALQGLHDLAGSGSARHRGMELGGDRGVHGCVGASRPVSQGADRDRHVRRFAGRTCVSGEGPGEREEADSDLHGGRAE